jgi:hypothetical protein
MSNNKQSGEPQHFVITPERNDILLGRGYYHRHDGNTNFRALVRSRSIEYWSCKDQANKHAIVRQIIDNVTSSGFRFLSKVRIRGNCDDADDVRRTAGVSTSSDKWELADKNTVLIKVKQTFRDFTASAKKQTTAARNITASSSLSSASNQHDKGNDTIGSISKVNNQQHGGNKPDRSMLTSNYRSNSSLLHNAPPVATYSNITDNSIPTLPFGDEYGTSLLQNIDSSQLDHILQHKLHHLETDKRMMAIMLEQRARFPALFQHVAYKSQGSDDPSQLNQQQDRISNLSNDPQLVSLLHEHLELSNISHLPMQIKPTLSRDESLFRSLGTIPHNLRNSTLYFPQEYGELLPLPYNQTTQYNDDQNLLSLSNGFGLAVLPPTGSPISNLGVMNTMMSSQMNDMHRTIANSFDFVPIHRMGNVASTVHLNIKSDSDNDNDNRKLPPTM